MNVQMLIAMAIAFAQSTVKSKAALTKEISTLDTAALMIANAKAQAVAELALIENP